MKSVAVVVIGLNEAESLHTCLSSVFASHVKPARVVYSDAGSSDNSRDIAESFCVEVVGSVSGRRSPGAARNAGFEKCQEEYVMFLDGDMTLDAEWLGRGLADIERSSNLACVFGRVCEVRSQTGLIRRALSIDWTKRAVGEAKAPGSGGLFRADALRRVGGYEPRLLAAEETELGHRLREAGFRIECIDASMGSHDLGPAGPGAYVRRAIRTGRSSAQLLKLDRVWLGWPIVRPLVYSCVLTAAVTGGLVSRSPLPPLVALGGFCGLFLRQLTRLHRRTGCWSDALIGTANGYAVVLPEAYGFVSELLSPSSRRGCAARDGGL